MAGCQPLFQELSLVPPFPRTSKITRPCPPPTVSSLSSPQSAHKPGRERGLPGPPIRQQRTRLHPRHHPHQCPSPTPSPSSHSLPHRVLTSLVANGVFPDPLHGSNTRDCIPDIAHAGRPFYTFLFRRCLHLPSRKVPAVRCCRALLHCQESGLSVAAAGGDKGCCSQGDCSGCERVEWERVWLCFRGVNYSLSAFLNGRQLSIDQPAGMFLRRQLDITDLARRADSGRGHCGSKSCSSECSSNGCSMSESRNHLAVVVNPVDHPGNVDGGGQGGDHQVAKDVTAQYVEGWDWIIPIRDRNTGMWDQVHVAVTGPMTIKDPHFVAVFPSQRGNDSHAAAGESEHADETHATEDSAPQHTHTLTSFFLLFPLLLLLHYSPSRPSLLPLLCVSPLLPHAHQLPPHPPPHALVSRALLHSQP
ncbi:unnamed protein product [Closterium sp. NIES-53]